MHVQWDERLLKTTLRRIRSWAGDYPILYTVLFGVLALAVQALITNSFLQMGNTLAGVLSLLLVPIAIVGFMLVRTLLEMLYETRHALGQHLDPTMTVGDPQNFSCELVDGPEREVAIRITNHDVAGEFQAKVIDLRGVESNPVPISVRWRGNESSTSRRIDQGDFDVLSVVRVRGRRAVDFLEPRLHDNDAYRRVVASHLAPTVGNGRQGNGNGRERSAGGGVIRRAATGVGQRGDLGSAATSAASGGSAIGPGGTSHQVEAVVRIVNRAADGEGRRTHLLTLRFGSGSDVPAAELTALASG